jgi:hypothetical protein
MASKNNGFTITLGDICAVAVLLVLGYIVYYCGPAILIVLPLMGGATFGVSAIKATSAIISQFREWSDPDRGKY